MKVTCQTILVECVQCEIVPYSSVSEKSGVVLVCGSWSVSSIRETEKPCGAGCDSEKFEGTHSGGRFDVPYMRSSKGIFERILKNE